MTATSRYLRQTELWAIEPDGSRFLMNTITSTSKFKDSSASQKDLHLSETQLAIARDQRDGWRFNGPYPNRKYEIVQKWSDGDVIVD